MTTELVLLNLVIALGSIVQMTAGLGFTMVATPLIGLISLAYLPDPMLFANIVLSIGMLFRGRAALDRREVAPLMGGLVCGTAVGAAFLTQISAERLGVVFGLLILAAVAVSILAPQVPLTRRNVLFGAIGSGFTGVVAGMHAPPLVMLYQREDPAKIRATFATVFVVGIVLALIGLAAIDRFGGAEILMGLSLFPGVLLGSIIGRILAGRVDRMMARAAMLIISGIGGVLLLVKSL